MSTQLPTSRDTITIDEEFRARCPPLTETERQMLRQDIERSGLLSPADRLESRGDEDSCGRPPPFAQMRFRAP